MVWCYQCEAENQVSLYSNVCNKCGSPAIQAVDSRSPHPSSFRPYVIRNEPQPEPAVRVEEEADVEIQPGDRLVNVEIRTVVLESLDRPGQMTVIHFLVVNGQPVAEQKTVNRETYQKLKKVANVPECSICQEVDSESGVMLGCRHAFHEKCIKPWFEQSNTCPCCRATVQ